MKLNVTLEPGVYAVGINRPWYATQGMVRSEVEKLTGLRNIVFHDRNDKVLLPVNPRLDPYYSNDWDEWLEGTYDGPKRVLPNTEKIWAWMIVRPKFTPQGVPVPLPIPMPVSTQITDATDSKKPVSTGFIVAAFAIDFLIARALYKAATKKRARKVPA